MMNPPFAHAGLMTVGKRAKNSATACVAVQQCAALIYVALSKRCGMQPREGGIEKSCVASRNSAILVTASLRVYSSMGQEFRRADSRRP